MGVGIEGGLRRATRTILAVDDSRRHLDALTARLGQLGYLMVPSDSGAEALDLLQGRGFDLVLLDMQAGGSAMHVLREIRGSLDTIDLPVVMIADGDAVATEAFAAGADDVVARPLAFDLLAARIERTLARASRMDALKRSNLALDARIAARAVELGEVRAELATIRADRTRLIASIQALHDEVERLSPGTSAFG